MIAFPNCKINLGLSVIERRRDGYHNIETIFNPLPLHDVLEIVPAHDEKTVFTSSGIEIPGEPDQNLCLKAYELLNKDFNLEPVKIHLHKVVPIGAGLGGGSSDAASSLMLLNDLFSLKLSRKKLLKYASQLGADCAFFILNKPVFANKKGDRFRSVKLDLSGKFIVLVKPDVHVGTAEAYAGITPGTRIFSVRQLVEKSMSGWKYTLFNDFEKSIFQKYPMIEEIKTKLYDAGAIYASMSGSGSAVYGIFEKAVDLQKAFNGFFYWSSIV